jgi:hypothetical protein
MKHKLSIDFAILTSLISVFLFTSGYIYLDSYTHFFGFNHSAFGFSFQDYLIHGWANNIFSLFIIFVMFLIISLINTLQEQDLYESITKICLGIFTFIILLTWKIISYTWKYTTLFLLAYLSNYLFLIFLMPLKKISIFVLKILFFFFEYIFNKSKPIFSPIFEQAKNTVDWKHESDSEKLDNAKKVFSYHYVYFVLFYLLFFSVLLYVVYVGKLGEKEAEKDFSNQSYRNIIVKNELLNEWITKKNFYLDFPSRTKLLLCGSNKCLIGIPISNLKNKNLESIPTRNNYLIMTVDPNQYIIMK